MSGLANKRNRELIMHWKAGWKWKILTSRSWQRIAIYQTVARRYGNQSSHSYLFSKRPQITSPAFLKSTLSSFEMFPHSKITKTRLKITCAIHTGSDIAEIWNEKALGYDNSITKTHLSFCPWSWCSLKSQLPQGS